MLSLLCTLQIVAAQVRDRAGARLRREEGASNVEWVIITGFLIILAAVVGRLDVAVATLERPMAQAA